MRKSSKSQEGRTPKRVVIDADNFSAFKGLSWEEDRPVQVLINEALTRERIRLNLSVEPRTRRPSAVDSSLSR